MDMMDFVMLLLGELAGGAVVAVAGCFVAWSAFKIVRRPEWGPLLLFAGSIFMLRDRIVASTFLQAVILVSGLCTAICWFEGKEWRARHPRRVPDAGLPGETCASVAPVGSSTGSRFPAGGTG